MTEMTETGAHADGGDPGSPPYPDASEEFMNPDLLRAEVEVMSYPDLLARARTFGEAAKVSTALLFVAKAVGRDLATIDLTRFKKAGEEALAGLDERQMEL